MVLMHSLKKLDIKSLESIYIQTFYLIRHHDKKIKSYFLGVLSGQNGNRISELAMSGH